MKYVMVFVAIFISTQTAADIWQDSPEVTNIFHAAKVNGTFVLYDLQTQQLTGYNPERARQRFLPASTFKIANSLIGLSSGAINSVDEVLPYGGEPQLFKSWEQDMSLRDAIVASNVPVYKELARRIGIEKMRQSVSDMTYGNGEVGTAVDEFWLEGPLKISAIEQTQFLARLAKGVLPFPEDEQKAVREITRIEQQEDLAIYAKTGWENASEQRVGWWVGWVQKGENVYAFALNMDMGDASAAPLRIELGKASLKALGVL